MISQKYQINPDEVISLMISQKNIHEAMQLDINAHLYKNFEDFKTLIEPLLK